MRVRLLPPLVAAQLAAALLALIAAPVAAKPAEKRVKTNPQVEQAKALLASSDHDSIETGIQSLGLLGTADAVAPLVERVRAGLAPDLLDTAIVTLMALGQPSAAPVLFDLASHRRPEVRLRAIEAIVALGPKGAEEVLRTGLSDQNPQVRSAAALGLGEIKAVGSVDLLFRALDHGNFEASTAIGKLVPREQIPRMLEYLGKTPLQSLGPALGEVLQRKDIGEREKLAIVSRLQDVGTPEVKSYLGDLMHLAGDKLPPPVSKAIVQAMQEIVD
jgi:HEAT repeat protein